MLDLQNSFEPPNQTVETLAVPDAAELPQKLFLWRIGAALFVILGIFLLLNPRLGNELKAGPIGSGEKHQRRGHGCGAAAPCAHNMRFLLGISAFVLQHT
jgi:hypothetical protein